MTTLSILKQLEGTSSRNEKESILRANENNELLKRVIKYALDPYTQFYIRKIPKYTPAADNQADFLDSVLDSLNMLSTRQVTGNAAIDYLTKLLSSLVADDAEVVERVVKRDLRCGVQEATANKIWSGLVEEYPCMLCSQYEERNVSKMKYPAYAQMKMDGMRFNAIVTNNGVTFRSRNGKVMDLGGNLESEFIELASLIGNDSVVFDGELMIMYPDDIQFADRQTGNGILSKAQKGTMSAKEAAMVHASLWDCIPLKEFKDGAYNVSYESRFEPINKLWKDNKLPKKIHIVYSQTVDSLEQAKELFQELLFNGHEGIILKDKNGVWENKRVKHQIKFKGELECDLIVTDWEEGTGKNAGKLGAIICESSDGKVKVGVGTGFTDAQRTLYTREETVGKIVAIKYNARIADRNTGQESLFLPVFTELRLDKDKPDSSESIK